MVKVEVRGMEALQARLKRTSATLAREAPKAVRVFAGEGMNEAQKRVPVVTGRLRSSAYIREVKRNQHRTDVRFGYEAPYAVFVHEIPYSGRTTRGKPGALRNGKGYKWLQRAFQKVKRNSASRVMDRIKHAVRTTWER